MGHMEKVLTTTYLSETSWDPHTATVWPSATLQFANATKGACMDSATGISKDIIDFLCIYFAPFLLFVGSFGNILSFIVFSRASLCGSAVSFYFRALAVADTLALNVGLWPNWIKYAFDKRLYPLNDVVCRIQTYLKYVLPDIAVWILVIMTVERLVAVCRPHRARRIFTATFNRASLLTMILAVSMINIPAIFMTDSSKKTQDPVCIVVNKQLIYVWPWVDLSIYCFLPSIIIITCNSVIISTIMRRQKAVPRRTSTRSETGHTMAAMTLTLLTVTVVFVLLTVPFGWYSCSLIYFRKDLPIEWCLFYITASFLRYVNNSVNFLLYCISGRSFRDELKQLCKKTADSRYRADGERVSRIYLNKNSALWNTLVNQFDIIAISHRESWFEKRHSQRDAERYMWFCFNYPHCTHVWQLKCCISMCFASTHWGRDKMAAIFHTTFSSAFSWMKIFQLRFKFHYSLFLRVHLTIRQHWFR